MARLSPQMKHVAAAKWTGLAIGALGFLAFTMVIGAGPGYLRWVIPLWYLTLGGIIGVAGWVDRIPLFNWPLPPLVRGAAFGAWMNLLGALFAWPEIAAALSALPGLPAGLASPWIIVIEGAIVGAIIDIVATRISGPVSWPGAFDPR